MNAVDLGSETAITTRANGRIHYRFHSRYDSPALRFLLSDPDSAMDWMGMERVKSDQTTTVTVASLDGRMVVVKRYNTKNAWHGLRRIVRTSRAENCWHFAHRLANLGIATAPPVAVMEERIMGVKGRSWLVCDHIEGTTLMDYMASTDSPLPSKVVDIAGRVVAIINSLHRNHIVHGDMKATNFIVNKGSPVVVDLDAMKHCKTRQRFRRGCERDWRRFHKNWMPHPELAALFVRLQRECDDSV